MALSEKEQQLLAQMEAALAAEDPKLAPTLRGNSTRAVHKRRASLAAVGFVVGVALLIAGMSSHWLVSVLGFVVMLAATAVALRSWRHVTPTVTSVPAPESDQDFLKGLEDKWRHRHDEGSA